MCSAAMGEMRSMRYLGVASDIECRSGRVFKELLSGVSWLIEVMEQHEKGRTSSSAASIEGGCLSTEN